MDYATRKRYKRLFDEYRDLHSRLKLTTDRDLRRGIWRRIFAIEPQLRVVR